MGCVESTGATGTVVEDVHPKVESDHVVKPSLSLSSQEPQECQQGFARHYTMGPKLITLEGQGVFGEVRFAENRFFKSPVAVKVWDLEKIAAAGGLPSSHSQRSNGERRASSGGMTRVRSNRSSSGMQSPRGGGMASPRGGMSSPRGASSPRGMSSPRGGRSPRAGGHGRSGSKGSSASGQDPQAKLNEAVQREIDALAEIGQHRHCLRFYEFFREQQVSYIITELWKESLPEYLDASPCVPLLEAQRLMAEMAHGLAHVHAAGFIHRNVKPENFVFGGESGKTMKLMDFGTAIKAPKIGGTCWEVIGTPAYMSPEMLGSETTEGYDQATDVWSLGAVYYTMLYGNIPYCPKEQHTAAKIKAAVVFGSPAPSFVPSHDRPALLIGGGAEVPREAEALVRGCLEREEGSRPTMAKVLQYGFLVEAQVQSLLHLTEKSWKGSLAKKASWPSDTSTATPLSRFTDTFNSDLDGYSHQGSKHSIRV